MGLTDSAGGQPAGKGSPAAQSQKAWQESLLRRLEPPQQAIRTRSPEMVAQRSGATLQPQGLSLDYWGRRVRITWPGLEARWLPTEEPCPTFDLAMLVYYLHTADGSPPADRWIAFRELPDGGFYHQAFQGYSGDRLARAFGKDPDGFHRACQATGGVPRPDLSETAYAFQPLPRISLAAVLWPGDDDFPTQAAVLFDAAAPHYLVTDGLALLGAGLAGRLLKARPS